MDTFRALQVLVLVSLVVLLAPRVVPGLRPWANKARLGALVIYLVGGLAILLAWLFGK